MKKEKIISTIDHTLLKQAATWEQIRDLCIEGMESGTASVCIPPSFVKQAAEFVDGRLPICTVIGFPNGYMTTAAKEFEKKVMAELEFLDMPKVEFFAEVSVDSCEERKVLYPAGYDKIEFYIKTS